MQKICLVFDISHSTLNALAFSQSYEVLYKDIREKKLLKDDDGYGCEDLLEIKSWVKETVSKINQDESLELIAMNFTGYAGAVVHLNEFKEPITEVYDHHRSLGYTTRNAFIEKYGDEDSLKKDLQVSEISFESPAIQLYWLKVNKSEVFKKVKYSLSIAQYLSSMYSDEYHIEYTTLGCYSSAWNFEKSNFHEWLEKENLSAFKLPILTTPKTTLKGISVGSSLYNKVAELQPFLKTTNEQFILLSTGDWTTCINPFNTTKANNSNLKNDCFNILDAEGNTMKMARLFSGNVHNRQIGHLAAHFNVAPDFYLNVKLDRDLIRKLRTQIPQVTPEATELGGMLDCPFMERNLNSFQSVEGAYHQFMMDLLAQQIASIKLTLDIQKNRKIYVAGELAQNEIFMELLSEAFHQRQVYKVGFPYIACLGAAMIIGKVWGAGDLDKKMLKIKSLA